MDEEERKMLARTLKLEEENNKLLKKINRSIQWGRFVRILYWLVILGSAVGAYYFLQPFFDSFSKTFGTFSSGVQNLKGIGSPLLDVQNLLKGLQL